MTLRKELYREQLTRFCAYCGHGMTKPGSWFATLKGSFTCTACNERNAFDYDESNPPGFFVSQKKTPSRS